MFETTNQFSYDNHKDLYLCWTWWICVSSLHPLSAGMTGWTLVDPITYQCSSLCSVTYEIHLDPRKSWNCLKRLKWLEKNGWNMRIFGENWGINGWTVAWKVLMYSVEYEHLKMSNKSSIVFIIWSLSFKYIENNLSGMQQIWRIVRLVSMTLNINSVSSDRGSWTFGKSNMIPRPIPFIVSALRNEITK